MTDSDRIPPHLREHIARAYARGRLDSTHPGGTWVHVTEFIRAAHREHPATLNGLHQLYNTMLTAGTHVYGAPTTRQPVPLARQQYMDHSRCDHRMTTTARAHCRDTARAAGTWPIAAHLAK